jgi:hypothetical protein
LTGQSGPGPRKQADLLLAGTGDEHRVQGWPTQMIKKSSAQARSRVNGGGRIDG